MRPKSTLRSFLSIASSAVLTFITSHAATLYWDGGTVDIGTDGNGLSGGTAGNWNTTLLNWDRGANLSHVAWNNSNNDTAVFGGTAGTVTLTAPVTVGGLQFNTHNYTVAASTQGLTFGGTDNTIRANGANSNVTATISGTVGGSGNVVLTALNGPSANTVNFTGASAGGWSGSTTINPGMTLVVGTTTASDPTNRALYNTSGITLNSGAMTLNFASGFNSDRISDTAPISVNGGGTFAIGTTNATLSETVGEVTLNSGQFNLNHINNPSSGGTITLTNFIRSGTTSALTVSQGANGRFRNAAVSTDTAAGEIIGAWATTGGQNGIGAQTDYAIYGNGNGTFLARNIAASAESTWSTSHAATSNYTLANTAGTALNGRLTATRNINTLRNTSTATSLTAVDTTTEIITVTGSSYSNGDVVTFGGTAPGGLSTGVAYYVINASGTTFQVAATSGGSAINLTNAGSSNVTGGITLSSGNNLGTYGILNGSTAALAIGGSGTGAVTLPVANATDNLYLTPGSAGITVNAPIINNGSGVLTLVKNGSGNLFLSGANTYTGGTVINAGGMTFQNSAAWVSNQNLTFGGSGTVIGPAGASLTGGTLNAGTGVNAILGVGVNTNFTFSSTTGTGTIIYNGTGILNLGNASAFTGNLLSSINSGNNSSRNIQFSSLADTAGTYLGWGGGEGDSNQRAMLTLNGNAGAVTLVNRQLAFLTRFAGNSALRRSILQNNNTSTSHTFVINTNLINNGDGVKQELIFDGSNTGNNAFNGIIGNSTFNGNAQRVYKTGAGKWILGGNNTFTGLVIVNQGTLSVSNINNADVAGPLGMSNSIQLGGADNPDGGSAYLGGNNSGTLEYTGVGQTSARSFQIGNPSYTGQNGTTGGGTIANNGSGALIFSAATFNPTQASITGTRTLTLGGSQAGVNEVQGIIQDNVASTGKVNLAKSGSGRWIVSGVNTYTGTTSVNGGVLQGLDGTGLPTASILQLRGGVFQSSGTFSRSLGTAAGNVNWATSSGGFAAIGGTLNLQLNGGTSSVTWNGSSMVSTGQTLIFGSSSADSLVDFQNALNLGSSGSGQRTIQVDDNTSSTTDIARISGAITNTVSGWGILKTGAGTLELTATNTYTGTTTVNGGNLVINGSTSTGAVNVGGASATGTPTLNGTGTVGGNTTIASASGGVAGTHSAGSAGSGIGTQTFSGNLEYQSGSLFQWDLASSTLGTRGTDYDGVTVDGTLSGTSSTFRVALGMGAYTDSFWDTDRTWSNIFTNSGGTPLSMGSIFSTVQWYEGNVNMTGSTSSEGYFTISGSDLKWIANTIPETSNLLIGILLGAGMIRRERRQSSASPTMMHAKKN